jgi:hypothetical protein
MDMTVKEDKQMFDFDMKGSMKDIEAEIRATCKITIRTLEIFYEELQNSNLPDEIKTALLVSKAGK